MDTKETLLKARELISNGWGQGSYVMDEADGPCRYCIVGALDYYGCAEEVAPLVAYLIPPYAGEKPKANNIARLIAYNDLTTTTKEDILNLIDKTLEKLK